MARYTRRKTSSRRRTYKKNSYRNSTYRKRKALRRSKSRKIPKSVAAKRIKAILRKTRR